MNPKLTNIAMGWSIFIFDIIVLILREKTILEFEEMHI